MDYEIIHLAKYLIWGVYHVCEHVFTMYAVYTGIPDPYSYVLNCAYTSESWHKFPDAIVIGC